MYSFHVSAQGHTLSAMKQMLVIRVHAGEGMLFHEDGAKIFRHYKIICSTAYYEGYHKIEAFCFLTTASSCMYL